MRKARTLIGQDVVSLADGAHITSVKNLVIGQDGRSLAALLVDEGGILRSSKVIPIDAVTSFGKDAVVIEGEDRIVEATSLAEIDEILHQDQELTGTKVMTQEGETKGTISDMYFEPGSGSIVGFEISTGALGDAASGPSFLRVEDVIGMGPDVAYIRAEAVAALDAQVGGVQGAIGDAQDQVGKASAAAKRGLDDARSQLEATIADVQERIPRPPTREEGDELINRRSGMDVTDPDGNVIIATGQPITQEHVDEARASGNLEVLKEAAEVGGILERDRAVDVAVEKARDSATGLWDQFTRKLTELSDESGRQVDAAQTKRRLSEIADAIGRPVTKVILDRNDDVVLDFGDILTHEAVQRAWDSGQLDSVLASIYRTEVTLEPQALRAGTPGQARIEEAGGEAPLISEMEQKLNSIDEKRVTTQKQSRARQDAEYRRREKERAERAKRRETEEAQRRESELVAAGTQESSQAEPVV